MTHFSYYILFYHSFFIFFIFDLLLKLTLLFDYVLSKIKAVFKATGSESLDDLITKCRKWTPNKRKQFESSLGIKPKSMQHEDVKATEGMSEDEEWEFLKKKYIPELAEENNETET
jgi:hypothetical protein